MADMTRWLTIREAADRACCRPTTIRRAVQSKRLRSARADALGEFRFLEAWIDEWLMDQLTPEDHEISLAIDAAPTRLREVW